MRDLTQDIKQLEPAVLSFDRDYGFKRWPELDFAYKYFYKRAWTITEITRKRFRDQPTLNDDEISGIIADTDRVTKKEFDFYDSIKHIVNMIPEHVRQPVFDHARLCGQNDWFEVKKVRKQ